MKWGLRGPHGWVTLGVTPNSEIGALSLRDWHNLPRPGARRGRQRRRRGCARAHRGAARALAHHAGMAVRIGIRLRRHQPLRTARATRRGPVGIARRGMAALDGDRSVPAGVRRRQRGHGGHHRCARRGRRLPRRPDPSRACGSCWPRSPRTRRASRCRPVRSARFRTTRRTRSTPARCRPSAAPVEQMRRRIDADPGHVRCYLAGGAAPEIGLHLDPPVEVIDNLVLEGVLALAEEVK